MRRLPLLGSLVLLAGVTAVAFVPRPAPGPGAIQDMLTGLFKAIDTGDRAAAQACLVDKDCAFPVQVYDLDTQNVPVTLEGIDAAHKYLDSIFDTLKKENIKVESKITKIHPDCHSPELGYATLEFTQTFTTGEEKETSAYRATVLVTWGKDQSKGPKIFHWHASLAKAPAHADKESGEPRKDGKK